MDRELIAWLRKDGHATAAERIKTLRAELDKANRRLGMYISHAEKRRRNAKR